MSKLLPVLMQLKTTIDFLLKDKEDFPTKNKEKVVEIFRDISEQFGALFSVAETEGRPCLRACLSHLQVSLNVGEGTGVVSFVYWHVLRRCRRAVSSLDVVDPVSPQQKVGDVLGSVYRDVERAMKERGCFSPEADVFLPPEDKDRSAAYIEGVNDFLGFLPFVQAEKLRPLWEQLQKSCCVEALDMDTLIRQNQQFCSLFVTNVVGKQQPTPTIQSSPVLNMKPELVRKVLIEVVSSGKDRLIHEYLIILPIYTLKGEELFAILKQAIKKRSKCFSLLLAYPSFAHMDRVYMDALLKLTTNPAVIEKLKETPGYKRKSSRNIT
jgi:hypothetical protein